MHKNKISTLSHTILQHLHYKIHCMPQLISNPLGNLSFGVVILRLHIACGMLLIAQCGG